MKPWLKNFIIILLTVGIILGVIFILVFKKDKSTTSKMEELISDMNLSHMQKNLEEQVSIHKKYIAHLKGMKSQIKTIGANIENKIQVAKTLGDIGDLYLKDKLLPMALAHYTLGLDLFPQDANLNYKKGLILGYFGSYEKENRLKYFKEAEKYYKIALSIDSTLSDPYYALALIYFVSYEDKLSVGSLQEALNHIIKYFQYTSSKRNFEAYFLQGRIAYAAGNTSLAIQSYQTIMNHAKAGSSEYLSAKQNIMQLSGSL